MKFIAEGMLPTINPIVAPEASNCESESGSTVGTIIHASSPKQLPPRISQKLTPITPSRE